MVRKFFTILLLALFVFNIIGYRLVVLFQQHQANNDLEALLNKNAYQQEDLFTLRIPINLPYQNSQSNFERVDGEITVNNETYKFVQRKVANDTLYLQCIKNIQKTTLQQKANDFFGKVNDIAGSELSAKKTPGKHNTISKYATQDFVTMFTVYTHDPLPAKGALYLIKPFTTKGCAYLQHLIKPPQTI